MTEPMGDAELDELAAEIAVNQAEGYEPSCHMLKAKWRAIVARITADRETIAALTAARDAALARAMPDGWVAVPREPTDAMYAAALRVTRDPGYGHVHDAAGGSVYRAMIAAAPPIPTPTQEG